VSRAGEAVLQAQLAAWDKVLAEHSKDKFFAKVVASQKSWARRILPNMHINDFDTAELAAAYRHFAGS
jgi:TRAP-type mannitol/chloroaromatic compound transport system substrate-binding protein